jgi:preprotein translocase subunit SecG
MDFMLLADIKWYWQALAVVFVIASILLIVVVLLQKGKGGGLSAAFGGAGGQSAFGSKTGDVFTWITIVIVGSYLLLAMILTMNYKPVNPLDETSIGAMGSSSGPSTASEPSGVLPEQQPTAPTETGPTIPTPPDDVSPEGGVGETTGTEPPIQDE